MSTTEEKTAGTEEVAGRTIDRITQMRNFEPFQRPQVGARFFIFRQRGDAIEGIIRSAVQNFQRTNSYPIELDTGEIVEIFANKLLQRIIERNELIYSRVRIVYIGRQFVWGGHARKIYRVFKIKGVITQIREEATK
jgi:hypothetical protein